MNKFYLIAMGGALGALLRYWAAGISHRLFGFAFPFGTFVVNMFGCFFFGFFWAMFESRLDPSANFRIFLLTGFMGAFTTYSTYMFETAQLMKSSQFLLLALNIGGQTILGIVLVLLGLALGKLI